MISFRNTTDAEKVANGPEYDTVLVCNDDKEFDIFFRAAKTRIAGSVAMDTPVDKWDEIVMERAQQKCSAMPMARTTVDSFLKLVKDYIEQNFIYDDKEIEPGKTTPLERAETLYRDMNIEIQYFDVMRNTDFDAYTQLLATAANPEWDEKEMKALLAGPSGTED